MAVVFVHGVTVRDTDAELKRIELRDANFATYLSEQCGGIPVDNPYWGKYGATFRWGLASMPPRAVQHFGPGELEASYAREIVETHAPGIPADAGDVLLRIAQHSVADAIDALWWATALAGKNLVPSQLAIASKHALAYAAEDPGGARAWVESCRNDDDFIIGVIGIAEERSAAAPQEQLFGGDEIYKALTDGLRLLGRRYAAAPAVNFFRTTLAEQMTLFVADVFEYLDTRGRVGPGGKIVDVVVRALRDAPPPLTVVGHSMGGNIAYDALTSFVPELQCANFVTVGSQVALFEELKKFRASDDSIRGPDDRVEKPANVARWINVYDPIDPFAYLAEPVFRGVDDIPFGKAVIPTAAHSDYFNRPEFYELLAARL